MHQFEFFEIEITKRENWYIFYKKKKILYKPLLSTYLQNITYKFKT